VALVEPWWSLGGALVEPWGSLGGALWWLWGAYQLAINRPWGGFDVALMWLWVACAVSGLYFCFLLSLCDGFTRVLDVGSWMYRSGGTLDVSYIHRPPSNARF
jgi:hypothetical protein